MGWVQNAMEEEPLKNTGEVFWRRWYRDGSGAKPEYGESVLVVSGNSILSCIFIGGVFIEKIDRPAVSIQYWSHLPKLPDPLYPD